MTNPLENILEKQAKDLLRNVLKSTVNMASEELDPLINITELVRYNKNHIIIEEGKPAEYFYFIYRGIVKIYFYKNDKLVIERFEDEGGIFGGNLINVSQKTGTHVYESMEDVVLLRIKCCALEELCKTSHTIERVYRIMMEAFHSSYVERLFSFKSLSSEERYKEFLKNYGNIVNRISLKDIANYLGMTPETLSRIRAKYDKT